MYHLIIFRLRDIRPPTVLTNEQPGVSVIIAVRNGSAQLKENLMDILLQDFLNFEILIVDDHSDPFERKNLEEIISISPRVQLLSSNEPGKKYALMTGIEEAKYDFILCTDVDCKPASKDWIRTMIEHSIDHSIVIGYSPYQKSSGWLNILIRFETLMTGIQYLSWAMNGRPYMAVGRNILYPKSLFLKAQPFHQHQDIPYGDDDLGLQAFAKSSISVCVEKKGHVISMPATSWLQWLKQKHRHLSAAHFYKPGVWWQPGMYGMALIGHWVLLYFMIDTLAWWKWLPLFVIGILFRWLTCIIWTRKLGDKDVIILYPLLEIIYAAYLAVVGTVTIVAKRKTWN